MNKELIKESLINIAGEDNVKIDEDMKKHTTFKAGGKAAFLVTPDSEEKVKGLIRFFNENEIANYIIGNGSNLLVRDEGFDGVILEIGSKLSEVVVNENKITAQAGALLSKTANQAYKSGLSGMEFASGIPGSVGGGVAMDAGAYGGELKDIVETVTMCDENGDEITLTVDEMDFSYRHSIVQDKNYIVLSATFSLTPKEPEKILETMNDLNQRRRDKQPLEYPSAGSTFKRPEGYFAGKLIQDAGLKGYSVGGACVSEKHSGFVINKGGATATDIITLIGDVQKIVKEKFGVELEPEVKIL
ncbi:MAG: UDP-N-acetylmuramate dehydrogenase [Lachnospiraceae bacterium]|nr:UDP-N-acetylmuramate dehydrogenase [Lachnospiraceae bacterium]